MAVLALHPPSPVRPPARVAPWLIAVAVVWGGFALFALLGPFSQWPTEWRSLYFGATAVLEGALFAAAARRRDFGRRLRLRSGSSQPPLA